MSEGGAGGKEGEHRGNWYTDVRMFRYNSHQFLDIMNNRSHNVFLILGLICDRRRMYILHCTCVYTVGCIFNASPLPSDTDRYECFHAASLGLYS